MVATAGIRSSGAYVTSVAGTSNGIRAAQSFVRVVFNYPSAGIRASNAYITTLNKTSNAIRTSAAYATVVVRGRIADPRLRAWTFTLDGHDFYVLALGDAATIVYDNATGQWHDWYDAEFDRWKLNTGFNWIGGQKFAEDFGSNILVGDDTTGTLWFLDPDTPYDEDRWSGPDTLHEFKRVATGQVAAFSRQTLPCFEVFLTADLGSPGITDTVTLYTSDDAGNTFLSQGAVTVVVGDFNSVPNWLSIGDISAPGRLFRIVDYGAVTRINGLDMNDPPGASNGG